ncbi:MAG: hypothetical protein EXS43_06910 [Opitutus sp.]|nr:hypothetical protein [Opitutus sp.]
MIGLGLTIWPVTLPAHPNHAAATPMSWAEQQQPVGIPGMARAEARLTVTILDAKTGEPTPVRVRITDENGKAVGMPFPRNAPGAAEARLAFPGSVVGLPPEAIGVMYGANDSALGYAFQPDGAFYVSGSFDLPMPAGKFTLTLSKGYEYTREVEQLVFKAGDHLVRKYPLRRWADMPERGWYSADDHIHLRRSPRDNPLILDWIAAEDVHVGVLLQMGDFWTTFFSQYAWGEKGRYGAGGYILTSGQEEPRTHELGHTISLGADRFVRFQNEYYSYDRVFDRVHELGGVSGYAHSAKSFHGYRGMTLDVLAGKIDFLEVMQFCVPQGPLALEHYYRFLDLGYKLTALGGSDFPWCGRGLRPGEEQVGAQIGDARFYTYVGRPFSFDRWLAGIKAGNTFVTTGPMLEFQVNDRLPGSSLDVKAGSKVRISATAYGHPSQIPLSRVQIIGHGKVLAEATPGGAGQTPGRLSVELELEVEHGIWLAARTDAGLGQIAHTTPVYVTVNGDGFHNRANLTAQIEASKRYLQEIRDLFNPSAEGANWQAVLYSTPSPALYRGAKEKLERRIAEAEAKLEALRGRR